MKRFLRHLYLSVVARDDLFSRVVWLLTGVLFGGLGVAMSVAGATQNSLMVLSWFPFFVYWSIAILFTTGGAIAASRCALSAQSRLARLLDKHLPDTPGLEEAALLLLAIYLPAVLLTLLLRSFGVQGRRTSSKISGKTNRPRRSARSV
jgi:hypothetical protein